MRHLLYEYFQGTADQKTRNSWIDLYQVWPIINLLLLCCSLICFLTQEVAKTPDPLLPVLVYIVTACSVGIEVLHFLCFLGLYSVWRR